MLIESKDIKIAVIGMGYVGLPVALEMAHAFPVMGYDIDMTRIAQLKNNNDITLEHEAKDFEGKDIRFTDDINEIASCNIYIIAVPTPVHEDKTPDLGPLEAATRSLSGIIKKGDVIIYESTVFPGCTEEICVPLLEAGSGLEYTADFKVGYSPERINPGDKIHTFTKVVKVVSGCDEETLNFVASLYGTIVKAGIHKTPNIKVAEASKIIENTQRDVNIALMNELALIFDRMDINTQDVLAASGTKWNFLKFYPGLVGGHCIDVDPYYLAHKAEDLGYTPKVILSGRQVNSEVADYIAQKVVAHFPEDGAPLSERRVLVMGLTFKENVSDIRNSRVFDLIDILAHRDIAVDAIDSHVKAKDLESPTNYNFMVTGQGPYDAVIVAVAHDDYRELDMVYYEGLLKSKGVLFDVKGIVSGKSDNLMVLEL